MVESDPGADIDACTDKSIPGDVRPVFGQPRRVIVTDLPNANLGPTRKFLSELKILQEDYPDCIIHIHGSYSYRVAFGLGFQAAEIEPRTLAQKGRITLPSGTNETYERVQAHPKWISGMGFKPVDLQVPRNRCIYNIKSAVWAGEHFNELYNFHSRRGVPVDRVTPPSEYKPPETKSALPASATPIYSDKVQCDFCSLAVKCSHFRSGAVCSLPDAEPKRLAAYFHTRDASTIIDGLGILMQAGAERLEEGRRVEQILGDIDPQVTKQIKQLFDQGVTLAKLLDPALRGGTKVNIGVGAGGRAAVQINGSPNALIAGVMRELEAQGVPAEKITPDMIEGVLKAMGEGVEQSRAIEGRTIEGTTA